MTSASCRRLIRNAALCIICGDIIESHHAAEVVRCSCGNAYVAGGLSDPERGSADGFIEDLSEYAESAPTPN